MDDLSARSKRPATALRWTARIIGTLFVVVFVAFFVTDAVQKETRAIESDVLPATFSLFLAFMGLIIAWKWEGVGGLVALGGLILYCILGLRTDVKPAATIFVAGIYALPAILFLVYWRQTKREDPKSRPADLGRSR
jgi:hypothetical protein